MADGITATGHEGRLPVEQEAVAQARVCSVGLRREVPASRSLTLAVLRSYHLLSVPDQVPHALPETGEAFIFGLALFPAGVNLLQDGRQLEVPERQVEVHLRSEEHTSELQSRQYLVCRLLLEKKKKYN